MSLLWYVFAQDFIQMFLLAQLPSGFSGGPPMNVSVSYSWIKQDLMRFRRQLSISGIGTRTTAAILTKKNSRNDSPQIDFSLTPHPFYEFDQPPSPL